MSQSEKEGSGHRPFKHAPTRPKTTQPKKRTLSLVPAPGSGFEQGRLTEKGGSSESVGSVHSAGNLTRREQTRLRGEDKGVGASDQRDRGGRA